MSRDDIEREYVHLNYIFAQYKNDTFCQALSERKSALEQEIRMSQGDASFNELARLTAWAVATIPEKHLK